VNRTLRQARNEAREALFRRIATLAERETRPLALLRLAEAWAWAAKPDQVHGQSTIVGRVDEDGDGADGDGDGGGDGD
jgi:hypothetical protein